MQSLLDLLAQVLEIPSEALTPESTADAIPAWDSMRTMDMVVALEEHYNTRFQTEEIMRFDSVAKVAECLENKGITPG